MKNTIPTLEQTIERMKNEVREYVADGIIPPTVESFGDLHDYIDANCLGGFCEDEVADAMIEHFGGRDPINEGMPDAFIDYMNSAQNAVHAWIAEGGHRE
jgi:hypothetical protein